MCNSTHVHALITRFNVRFNDGDAFDIYNDDWMRKRLELFSRYCLPSIKNQTMTPDHWFIVFDPKRSEKWLSEITRLTVDVPFIKPVFVDHVSGIRDALVGYLDFNGAPIITTRLDNDDILHPSFIADVSNALLDPGNTFFDTPYVIDFPNTCFWNIQDNSIVQQHYELTTAFSSLVEYPGTEADFQSVISVNHLELKMKYGLVRYLPEIRTMAVVHGGNVANGVQAKGIRSFLSRILLPPTAQKMRQDDADQVRCAFGISIQP